MNPCESWRIDAGPNHFGPTVLEMKRPDGAQVLVVVPISRRHGVRKFTKPLLVFRIVSCVERPGLLALHGKMWGGCVLVLLFVSTELLCTVQLFSGTSPMSCSSSASNGPPESRRGQRYTTRSVYVNKWTF